MSPLRRGKATEILGQKKTTLYQGSRGKATEILGQKNTDYTREVGAKLERFWGRKNPFVGAKLQRF